jgi:hypothetical protein
MIFSVDDLERDEVSYPSMSCDGWIIFSLELACLATSIDKEGKGKCE